MNYQTDVSLGYKDLFDDYDNVNPNELIKDIPSRAALEILGYIMAQLHTQERNFKTQIAILKMWIGRLPQELVPLIEDYINQTTIKGKSQFNFANNISALLLVELLIENHNEIQIEGDLTPEQELNLFKAYLWCTQFWTDKQLKAFKGNITNIDELIELFWPFQLPILENLESKDFRFQYLKALYFFKFCENNEVFKEYLQIFLQEYQLKSWEKYLENILSLYIRKFENLKTPSILTIDSEYKEVQDFIENLCIDVSEFKKTDDFTGIRSKPIYKIDKNSYLFLNLNFFVDKLFQGVQFEFFRVLRKHQAKFNGKEIKGFDTFRSIYADQFSETGLFYKVLKYSFEKNNYKLISGEELKKDLREGEPDFYIRDKSKIYLFEYKDVIINSEVKHSYDFEKIRDEITKKMISNQKGKQKGITQLLNTIENLQAGKFFQSDKLDNIDSAIIYPIIVFTDFTFNLPGVNFYLNSEFRKLLKNSSIKNHGNIKDLTLIDLDTFIKFQDLFREKKIKFNNLLNEYSESMTKSKDFFDKLNTFNIYIHNKTREMNYNSPKQLMQEMKKMLKE
jgi:hypothetical protein